MFGFIDATGSARKDDPRLRDVEAEMIRSHALCQKISAKKPTDPDYKGLLEELFQCEIDDSVAIVSPFYCDCGRRMKLGRNIIINKGATILSPGIVEIEDNVLIAPEVKITTVNHDLHDRHNLLHFAKVTIKENAWICIGAIICPGVTIGKNAIVAAGACRNKRCPRQRGGWWQSRQNHKKTLNYGEATNNRTIGANTDLGIERSGEESPCMAR